MRTPPPRQDKDLFGFVWQEWFRGLFDITTNEKIVKLVESTGNPARGTSAPTQVFLNNVSGWKFAVGDNTYYDMLVPLDWYKDGNFTLEIHWYSSNTTAARYIQWQVDWQSIAIGEVITAPGSSGVLVSGDILLSTTANILQETIMPTIAGTLITAGDHLLFKISRIASAGTAPAAGDNPIHVHTEIEYQAHGIR